MTDMNEKVKEIIKKTINTNRVVIVSQEYSVTNATDTGDIEDRRGWTQIDVDAVVGEEYLRMHFRLLLDGEEICHVDYCSLPADKNLASRFRREYNDFKLSRMTKQKIFILLVKANKRRKTAERKEKKLWKLVFDIWNSHCRAVDSRQRTIEKQWEVMRELQRRGLVSTEALEEVLWDVMRVRRIKFKTE